MGGWFEAREHLLFDIALDQVPTELTIAQVYLLFTCFGKGEEEDWTAVLAYIRTHHIHIVGDLWLEDG